MSNFNIKQIIQSNKAYFHYYRHQVMYYKICYDDMWYSFPVPLNDIGDATLNDNDKAIFFMRYIRQAISDGTFVSIS